MLTMGVVRGISHGLFGAPDEFGSAVRDLNASLVRAFLYWGQVEPQPGVFDWTVIDRLLQQVKGSGRLWLTVCSSSLWATRTSTSFLPPSPPVDASAYARFVRELVGRCESKVSYWQCENEPSNVGLRWSGTAVEYGDLLTTFAESVRAVPASGQIVLGGMGYEVLSSEAGSAAWQFFDTVLAAAGSSFDLVDVHSYDDPRRIPGHFAAVRALLAKNGCAQPLVVGEYGGPTIFGFSVAERAVQAAIMAAVPETSPLLPEERTQGEAPDRLAMRELYKHLSELPPELQQFLDGCPSELAARRDRIACREIVTRNLIAFAEGVTTTCCWGLAPEVPDFSDPYDMLGLVSARLDLFEFRDGTFKDAQPAADAFRLLAGALQDAIAVERIILGDRRDVWAFNVVFPSGSGRAVQVLWRDADPFAGDEEGHGAFEWHWVHEHIHVFNAFAEEVSIPVWNHGLLAVPLSATPILLSSMPLPIPGIRQNR